MKRSFRRKALVTTSLGAMLAVPGVAMAQETCIEVLGTISSDTQVSAPATDGRVQADALIVTARQGGDQARCVESLEELQAMLRGGESGLAVGLSAGDAAAVTTPPDVPEVEDEMADVEAAAETDADMTAEVAPDTDDAMAADAEVSVEAGAPLGNATEMLSGITAGEVEGTDVLSPDGDDIGTVEFLVVDTEGRVNVVVSLDDGVLGIGDSERVVTLDQFDYNAEEEAFVLVQLSEEWLETLPEYDSDTPGYVQIDADAYAFSN